MRIAHLVGHRALNGVATSVYMLAHQQAQAGHDVMIVYPERSWMAKQTFDPAIHLVSSSFISMPREVYRIGAALRDWRCDVIHAHGSKGNKFGMAFRIFAGAPVIMTAHARKYQLPWMAAHIVIGHSRDAGSYFTARGLARKSSIRVIPNMFALEGIEAVSPQARQMAKSALGVPEGKLVLGAVGAIGTRKNQAAMLKLLRDARRRGVEACLVVVGGPETAKGAPEEFQRLAADPEIAPHLHLTGHRTDAAEIIPAFDIYLMMSKAEEAPVAPLEAMARAIPVVSYDVGNMAEITGPALFVRQGDEAGALEAVLRLAQDAEIRAAAGADARETVRLKLDPAIVLAQIDDAYRDAMKRTPRFKKHQSAWLKLLSR